MYGQVKSEEVKSKNPERLRIRDFVYGLQKRYFCCFCVWIRTLTIIIRYVKSLILRAFFIVRAGLGGSDFLAFSFAFGSKEFWTAINLDLSNLVGGEPPSVDQWLHHFETAYKNHRNLFLGIYRYAFEQLSYDLLIILHRSVFQSVQDGVYIVESGLGFIGTKPLC